MSEVIEGFKLMKQAGRERRAENLASNTKRLKDEGITYLSKNSGYHLIVLVGDNRVDFFPSSNKWMGAKKQKGYGIDSLLAYIKSLNNV